MNINTIKKYIIQNMNKNLNFKYNSGRGQIDEFIGEIIKTYNGIFLVMSYKENRIKSFSYSDVLIRNLIIN